LNTCGLTEYDEANFLADALLVTSEATFAIAYGRVDLVEAASTYGVSPTMMRYRLNVTGAQKRAGRLRASALFR